VAEVAEVLRVGGEAALKEWRHMIDLLEAPELTAAVQTAGEAIVAALESGGKILFAGNGGSAAEASHLAGEFVGRCTHDRSPLPAVALNDVSAVTAIANDYGFDDVYVRGVLALGSPGDVFVGLSTSGSSVNVRKAMAAASSNGLTTIAMTGQQGSAFAAMADHGLQAPSTHTPRVQEVHLLWGHTWCDAVDRVWSAKAGSPVPDGGGR
jgi:D-sedoheptulose 7-phosphate isomerase